jgi:hypothetical protein
MAGMMGMVSGIVGADTVSSFTGGTPSAATGQTGAPTDIGSALGQRGLPFN